MEFGYAAALGDRLSRGLVPVLGDCGKNQTGPWGKKIAIITIVLTMLRLIEFFLVVQQRPPNSDCKMGHQTERGA